MFKHETQDLYITKIPSQAPASQRQLRNVVRSLVTTLKMTPLDYMSIGALLQETSLFLT